MSSKSDRRLESLERLFDKTVEACHEILDNGNPSSAELKAISAFLKDNDVTLLGALEAFQNHPVVSLAEKLPFTDPEETPVQEEDVA